MLNSMSVWRASERVRAGDTRRKHMLHINTYHKSSSSLQPAQIVIHTFGEYIQMVHCHFYCFRISHLFPVSSEYGLISFASRLVCVCVCASVCRGHPTKRDIFASNYFCKCLTNSSADNCIHGGMASGRVADHSE